MGRGDFLKRYINLTIMIAIDKSCFLLLHFLVQTRTDSVWKTYQQGFSCLCSSKSLLLLGSIQVDRAWVELLLSGLGAVTSNRM